MSTSASTAAQGADSRQSAAELDISAKVSSDFEKAKVLLVDDSRLIRMGLRRSLVEIGLTDITEAGDGREAIQPRGALPARLRFRSAFRGHACSG